jgi:hypothetical protein
MSKDMTVYELLSEIQQKLNAPKNRWNKFGEYYYRNCEDICNAAKLLLNGATLTLSDEMVVLGEGEFARFYVKATATLTYKGETFSVSAYAREDFTKKKMDGSQLTGAAGSYARKYALNGLFAIHNVNDSDNTNTHGKSSSEPQEEPKSIDPYPHLAKKFKVPVKDIKARLVDLGFDTEQKIISAGSEKIIKILKESINE